MTRFLTLATLAIFGLVVALGPGTAVAQYPCYSDGGITYANPAPVNYFAGASYSLYQPSYSSGYYVPSYSSNYYSAPRLYSQPRYYNPGPYYYTPAYSYTPGYYSYYYTPGYFRY